MKNIFTLKILALNKTSCIIYYTLITRRDVMDRDSWLQDYDGYCESQWRWQQELEKQEYEEEQALEKYKQEKYK